MVLINVVRLLLVDVVLLGLGDALVEIIMLVEDVALVEVVH